jgi:oligogalacturonide lyase
MRRLVFVSHRTGRPQLFAEEQPTGRLVQLTDRDDLAEWSLHPSHDGRHVFFVAGTGAWRLDLETLAEERLADFGAVEMRERGMVGAAMGTTTVSRDDRWWAIPVKAGKVSRFVVIDTASGRSRVILERDSIGHPQFCPDDPDLIFYAGPLTDRLWLVGRDGSGNRRLWRASAEQWVTHEAGSPAAASSHSSTGRRHARDRRRHRCLRWITRFPPGTPSDDTGRWIVCDTNFPTSGCIAFRRRARASPSACASPARARSARTGAARFLQRRSREVTRPSTHRTAPSPDGSACSTPPT